MWDWISGKRKKQGETITLHVDGMHCGACVRRVTAALESLPGVHVERVDVGSARLRADERQPAVAAAVAALAQAGFTAQEAPSP